MKRMSRREFFRNAGGATVALAVGGRAAAAAAEAAAGSRSAMPASCFVNLNQPQRYGNTGMADLSGRTRFPVLDTRQLRDADNVELRFHAATKHGPVMEADKPWETGVSLYGSVLHDGQRFRMWYEPTPPGQGGNPYDIGYAESTDGVHWTKPNLGVDAIDGSTANNHTNMKGHSSSVVDLGTAVPPERRFFGIATLYPPKAGLTELLAHEQTRELHSYYAWYSADGFRWKLYPVPDCAVIPRMSDTASFAADPWRNRILGTVKLEPRVRLFDRRSVAVSAAPFDNVLDWEAPRLSLFPDELDDRMARERGCRFAEFYGMGLFPGRDVIIGFPEIYWVEGELHPSQAAGVRLGYHGRAEIQFAYSFDGCSWHRATGRRPLIPLGEPGEWDDGFLTMGSSAVEMDDEVFLYYAAYPGGHSSPEWRHKKIGLAKLKRDRFASLEAGNTGMAEFYHGPAAGTGLCANLRTHKAGTVRVEIREAQGKGSTPVPGFEAEACTPLRGDHVSAPVTWKTGNWADLAPKRNLVIRFHLDRANLFAYEIRNPRA